MNNLKYAPDEYTKIEGNGQPVSEIRSVTRGFNEGISHMYANPVERERMIIEAATQQAQRLAIASVTRIQLKSVL